MKYLIPLLLFLSACANQGNKDVSQILTDRTWLTEAKNQYWYSSEDGREYVWLTFEKREDGTYTPFSEATGTPQSNPIPQKPGYYREGWHQSRYFTVRGDTLILQDDDDPHAEWLSKFVLERIPDTTIGVHEYIRLRATNPYHSQIWRSRK